MPAWRPACHRTLGARYKSAYDTDIRNRQTMTHLVDLWRSIQSAVMPLQRMRSSETIWQPEPLRLAASRSQALAYGVLIVAVMLLGIVLLLQFAPQNVGYDYEIFHDVGLKLLNGRPIYDQGVQSDGRYYRLIYLPHVAILMAPLSLLPKRLAWAIICVLSVSVMFLIGRRWRLSPLQLVLAVTGLPALHSFYLGNLDALVTGTLLLPVEWQIVGVLTKPQVAIGLAPRALTRRMAWLLIAAIAALAIAYGFSDSFLYLPQAQALDVNLWHAVNPWQMVVGLAVFGLGMWRKDERLLLGCSPLLSPYALLAGMVPLWMAICATANRWVSLALWGAAYLAVAWFVYHPL
jgi:uncharacterized membrane protein